MHGPPAPVVLERERRRVRAHAARSDPDGHRAAQSRSPPLPRLCGAPRIISGGTLETPALFRKRVHPVLSLALAFFLSPSCRSCESVFFPVFLPASISRLFPPRAPIVLPGSSPAGFQHPPRSTRSAALRSHGPPRRGTAPNPPVLRGSTVVAVRPSRHVQVAIMGAPPPRAIGRETRRPHSPASLRLRETCSQPLRTKHPCTTCCLSAPAAASPLRRRGAGRDCGAKEGHPRLERARSARAPTTPLRAPPASLIPASGPARFANCNAHSLGRADTRNTPRAPRWWPRGLSHREGGQHQRPDPRAGTPPAGRSRGSEDARGQRAHDERSLQGHAAEL